ncbi:MAG: DUF4465 domain-containing protein [Prevotella sp.]|nr:DUF4465 domain-containing protein [Prevotella sp.]
MKQFQLIMLLLLTAMFGIPIEAQADREVLQQQFGKQVITVASDEVITFKDPKGDTDYTGTTSENAQSLTVFQPAEAGMSIQITFESMNMGGSGNYYSFANVYSGDPDPNNTFSWASTTGEVSSTYSASLLPSGDILRAYPNEKGTTYTNETYTSAAADGSLSVGFAYRYAYSCTGWVAKVKVVKLENMTVTGSGSNYDGVVAAPTERNDVALANAYVTAEGVMNPDNVTGIWFTMTQNENAVDPLSLKLYKGNTQINATVAADGTGYKFTLNEAPGDGTTTYTIKGDFLATAATGAKVEVAVTKVATVANPNGIASFTAGTSVAVAAPAKKVLQPQFGKQIVEVADGDEIPFYDPWGTQNISGSTSYNAQSLVVFKPAEAGKSVRITFEELDLKQYGASYPIYLNIYDGVADADNSFTFATSTSGVNGSSSFANMTGTLQAEKINNDNKPSLPATYTSNTSDGALSVGFLHYNSSNCTGWVAKVTVVQLENMTITGAGSNYEGVSSELTYKQNVALANAYVTATGVMNPDNVTGIYFTLTQNESVVDPTALKLFKGDTQVSATVETDGTGYKFVLNEAPAEGTTNFTIKGDILGTAAIGAKVQVDITKITTTALTDGITPFTAGTSVEITNPALVLMSATPQTITVGETPLQFYDEGGKDGGIVSKTNGQVTFLSGVEGKKVMVDFTKNEIWHGSLYNQELRIYNGQTVDAANLIKTLQQGETGIVRSTAEDGSLTVVLFSDASNDVVANGFEAEVSLFTPQPMDFDGITVTAASIETVCAGDENQDMLTINVDALNTEPAMQVTKMAFSAGENYVLATKATLYFGSTKMGETAVEGPAFEIALTTPHPLTEGENVFTLKYNISEEALNNQAVSAKLLSVTALVNNAEKTETLTSPTAIERTVKNIVLSHADQGTVTKTVNGSMAFETKPKNEYSTTYETGTDNRINIFVPKHEGMVCQIDFESFKIYYYSYNVSSSAKFKIYNGQGTTGEVLWEPSTQSDYTSGPSRIIRSTATDGALTIVFNPNSSYSTNDGWKATVSEYQSKDMEVTETVVTQASTADASIGAADQELLTVNVKTEGNLTALSLNGMKLNLKDTQANITKVSVWQGETKLGEATAAAEVDVTLAEAVTLNEGDNLFTVKADVSENATENQTIDAKVVSVKVGSNDEAVTNGDPEGARTLKNQVLMTDGNHGTLNLGLGKTVAIYDDGGSEGDGADGVEATITLAPSGDAESIKLTCQNINFSYTAYLYIYEGSEVNDEKLLIDNKGASKPFSPIIVDGPLTIKYVGAGSYTKPNFAITAEGYKKSDVVVTGVTTEDISVSEVLKGQTDVKMLKVMVEAKGELTPATITGFNITGIDGEPVDAYHIYQTGTTTSFSANEAFSESYSVTNTGTYYFWITYDVKTTATVGQTASATLNSITVDEQTITVEEPATASFTVASGKSGTYTVGGENPTYATIQEAVDDLGTLGMEGPVTLNIRADEYNEKVRIPYIKGMGAVNTLTLQSESGQRDVKIYHNSYTTSGYSDDQHKKDYGVVTLYQADYVTLKNLEIYTTDKAYKAVVMIKDESRHATIDNCYLHAPICTTTGEDVSLVGHTIIDEENKNNDYLTVKNCLLEGGKMGISMGGTSYVALPKEVGGVIEGNTLKNNGTKSLYIMDELGVKIKNNTIIIDADAETKISVGILDMQLRDEYAEATEITGNIFNVAPKTYAAVMNLRQLEGTEDAPVIIANNVINLASLTTSYAAFKFNGANIKNVNVANNTIRMTGTNGGAAFWASSALADGYGNVNVVNNIIQNETDGYAVNLYNDANLDASKINFQNNVMYTAGTTFYRAASSTSGDFASFVEKTGATGCINKQVTFLSDNVLEPENDLDGDLTTAVALAYVPTDINGKVRPTTNITIGAYEYDTNANAAPVMAEGYPQVLTHLDGNAKFSVKTDIAATIYYMVKKSSEEEPTKDALKTSETKLDVAANTEGFIELEGLEDEAEYIAYFLPVSLRNVEAEAISQTTAFTMEVTPPITDAPTAEVYIGSGTEETVNAGEEVTLMAMVLVDPRTAPYTLTWMDSKHTVLLSDTYNSADDIDDLFMTTATPTECTDYIFTVVDAAGKSCTETVRAIVSGDLQVATFENLWTDPEDGFWMGDFSKGLEGSTFVSGSFRFSNFACDTWNGEPTTPWWGNYAYSQTTTNAFSSYITDQFNNAVGGGVDGSETFLVAYPQGGTIDVINNENGAEIPGCYITNDAWVVDAILHGDGMSTEDGTASGTFTGNEGFKTGDWFLLTITADNGNSIEYYLADYRSSDEAEHYYVNEWEWIDLSSLGTVKSLSFTMTSSRNSSWGMTTPGYFCIDNLGAESPAGSGITTNIKGLSVVEAAKGVYSIDGKVLTRGSKQKGVQIIRMKDGSVRKVVR